MNLSFKTFPKIHELPNIPQNKSLVAIEVIEGVLFFRASEFSQNQIENLLSKQKASKLTDTEETELNLYEDLDDYLSFLNRLTDVRTNNFDNGKS